MIRPNPHLNEVRFVCMNLRQKSRAEIAGLLDVPATDYAAYLHSRQGFHWVGYHDGLPAALIGAYPQRPGLWSLYGLGTDDWAEIWRDVTRVAKRDMMSSVLATDCRRAECLSLADHHDTHRWLNLLGASHRAEMPQYGLNGQDYILFSWLRGK
jgi:hypothetical protein